MARGGTQVTEPLPEGMVQSAPERSRRVWPWIVAFAIVAVLAVAAWFAAEAIARQVVTGIVQDQVRTQLSLPADQQIDVGIEGAVLPQLIAGTLTELTISSDDVTIGGQGSDAQVTGDISVVAHGVSVRDGAITDADATVVLDEQQLRELMSNVDGFPVDSLGLAAPNITMEVDLTLFGATVPVGAALTPSADQGDLVLTPASLQLGGAEVSAAQVQKTFGRLADGVVRDWDVCVAQYLPAGVTLTAVEVTGDALVADFDVDGAIATDPALQENGTCA
ncbi:DUF2993 domain-containing protein [Microbacterium sp. LWH3-1.2]|uniref:LmeA family phospholipid-binding protein n=1 Tax=Microbacterium sp. LWH3-1.2 TaxID=3135256 RepID=UPI003446E85B